MPKKPLAKGKVKAKKKKKPKQTNFIPRWVKAMWGVRCREDRQGTLWIGKGRKGAGVLLADLLDEDEIERIQQTLYFGRENRRGCFWICRAEQTVTMQTGDWEDNTHYGLTY